MNEEVFSKFTVAITSPFMGFAFSHSTLNLWLQTISLTVGISVGVIAFLSALKAYKNLNKSVDKTNKKTK
jgi:hypothetical protein